MYKRKTCMFTRATTYDIINRTYHGGAILFFTFILFFFFFTFFLSFTLSFSLFLSLSVCLSVSLYFSLFLFLFYYQQANLFIEEMRRFLRNTFGWTNLETTEKDRRGKIANWMDCCTRDEKRNCSLRGLELVDGMVAVCRTLSRGTAIVAVIFENEDIAVA